MRCAKMIARSACDTPTFITHGSQGLGAYSFAPAILPLGCFDTPSAELLNCTFTGDSPFALRFCPLAGGVAMDHSCRAALE